MKRFISFLLTAVMLFTLIPFGAISAFAEDDYYEDENGYAYQLSEDGTYYSFWYVITPTAVVNIPSEANGLPVKAISPSAFKNDTTLTTITIPDSVTSIGDYAFYDCESLTSVTIGDGVTSIGDEAFENCDSLTSITIPDSVTSIGWYAFAWCYNLTAVYITDIAAWCNIDFYDGYSNPLYYAKNLYLNGNLVTDLVIPDSVTSIGGLAFYYCTRLTSITIPDSVTTIGGGAFYSCSSLTSITIPDSVTSIGDEAFRDCNNLIRIDVPDTVCLDGNVFDNTGLTQRRYGNGYYYGNDSNPYQIFYDTVDTSITSISFHKDTKIIAGDAFRSCDSLTSVTIPDSVTTIGDGAFYWCTSLTSVTLGDSVTSIGSKAFYYCKRLTSITIPDSVTSIGESAFYWCSNLNAVYITDIAAWCNIDFYDDSSNPLYYAKNLYLNGNLVTDLVIPDSVTSIGDYAFYNCSSLKSILIPDSVTSIGEGACTGIGRIYCEAKSQPEGWNSSYCSSNSSIYWSVMLYNDIMYQTQSDGTYSVLEYFYSGDIVIPSMVKGVPVTSIGNNAFSGCSGLTSITIPDGVTSIGDEAFYSCSNLTAVYITDIAAWCNIDFYDNSSNPLYYAKNLYLNGSLVTDLVIPDSVTSIGDYAFYYCTSLTSVTILDSVTSIGDYAFYECASLTSIAIPDTVCLGSNVFNSTGLTKRRYGNGYYCGSDSNPYQIFYYTVDTSITSIPFHKDTKIIAGNAFYYCTSLTSITIPDGVTSIGELAFYSCSSLTSITISDSVTSIGNYAFRSCDSLTSITIGDSVTSIGDNAFSYCDSLTSITIPDSVTTIGDGAFYSCSSLTSITIPDSVTSIGDEAFYWCENLTDIYCETESQPEGWNKNWLGNCTATVHWGCSERQSEKEALDSAILDAETLTEDAFSTEQWANIQTALDFAKAYDATDKSVEDIKSVTEVLAEIVAGAPLVKGDADRSGEVDQFDYLLLKRAYFDTYNLYSGDLLRADVDQNGEVDQMDYLCIKRAYFGTYVIA